MNAIVSRTPAKAILVSATHKGCGGALNFSGREHPDWDGEVKTTLYSHVCAKCGKTDYFSAKYPAVEHVPG